MLIIQIKDSEGKSESLVMDGSYEDREVFISEFTEKVERLRAAGDDEGETMIERMERSGRWIKIK